jgi:hypothetical protein
LFDTKNYNYLSITFFLLNSLVARLTHLMWRNIESEVRTPTIPIISLVGIIWATLIKPITFFILNKKYSKLKFYNIGYKTIKSVYFRSYITWRSNTGRGAPHIYKPTVIFWIWGSYHFPINILPVHFILDTLNHVVINS